MIGEVRALVCGGRTFNGWYAFEALDHVRNQLGMTYLIHGAARGADSLAQAWALSRGVRYTAFVAQWSALGPAAGMVRNRQMLDEGKPDYVVAFTEGSGPGTRNMIGISRKRGLPVYLISANGMTRAA